LGRNKEKIMIVASNGSGLGNRIKAIISCLRVSPEAKVYWPQVPGVFSSEFSDLFENNIEVSNISGRKYDSWRMLVLPTDPIPDGFSIVTADVDRIGRKFSHTNSNGRNIDLEYSRIPRVVLDDCVEKLGVLKINKKVVQWVNETSKTFTEKTVSVHIRSWEDQDPDEESRLRQKHFFNLNNFLEEMYKFDNDTNFFVCSDSENIIKKLKKIFGTRILTYERHSDLETSRSTRVGGQDDLAEMILLSKNKVIIGSYISTFTEMAWYFGGAKAEVIIC
jgi:hypothetical protein